jgi:hypothetical protein
MQCLHCCVNGETGQENTGKCFFGSYWNYNCLTLRPPTNRHLHGMRELHVSQVAWLSPFLLAAWDPETEQLQSVCRWA